MSKRTIGFALIVLGIVVSVLSLTADAIGFGAAPTAVGWKQIIGAVVGILIAISGVWLSRSQANSRKDQPK